MTYTGQSLKRFEDPRLLRGEGSFVGDMTLPGMLHAVVVRSPHAHARILSIDTSAARDLPGVAAVLTGRDIAGRVKSVPPRYMKELEGVKVPEHPALAQDKALYVGQAVAVVAAESLYQARDALEAVRVSYQPLKPLMDPWEAADEASQPIHEDLESNAIMRVRVGRGDLDACFARADRVVRGTYDSPRLSAAPMEGRALLAQYDAPEDRLTLWSSTQTPHKTKSHLARLLPRPPVNIRVIAPDVGGGFGQKVEVWPEDLALAYLAIELGRPVKWVEERWENLLAYQARGYIGEVEAAVKNDGAILGMRVRMVADVGAYFLTSTPGPPANAVRRFNGPYAIPDMDAEAVCVLTNKPSTGPYRGAGGPEGALFMERTIDLIAKELDLDPAEVRRRNLIEPEAFPYAAATGLTYDSGDYAPSLEKALEMSDYDKFRQAQRDRSPGEGLIGIGLATVVKASGGGSSGMLDSIARITVDPGGGVKVHTEVSPHGQGTETTFAQIAADALGVKIEEVAVLHSDTDMLPSGQGTFASRGLSVGASAMHAGLQQARSKLALIAAHVLECPPENVDFHQGAVFNKMDRERAMAFSELASIAHRPQQLPPGIEPGLEFQTEFTLPSNPFSFGAHVAVVEIDPDTGEIEFLRYAAVHDSGRVVNPKLQEGQVHGALAQGLGQALMEVTGYTPEGQPLNGTFMDYGMPLASDMPPFNLDYAETESPVTALGVKGIGELPTVAAPAAVANAVMDALSVAGVTHVDTPLTPEKIWRALRNQGRQDGLTGPTT